MIRELYYNAFGNFVTEWKEYIKNSEIFWHNQKYQKSTWDSPIFILLS